MLIKAGDQELRTFSRRSAGRMQHEPIVHHGPFVRDTNEDIVQAYQNYRAGHMGPLNECASQRGHGRMRTHSWDAYERAIANFKLVRLLCLFRLFRLCILRAWNKY